ncbi:MAG: flagellar basal body P-ring formation protein FlgA [Candidatus Rokubacteria bacterium]|nr:flagellar basal body P-ring formation protein FlgA [Candidatus Rokubacteria bacterium]
MKPLIVGLLLLTVAAGTPAVAGAAATVILPSEATVPGPQVRLGEIAEVRTKDQALAARLLALDLGTAAPAGLTRIIDRAALRQRLRQAEVPGDIEFAGAERVHVSTDAVEVPPDMILDTAHRWLLERLHADPAQTIATPLSVPRGVVLPRGNPTLRVHHHGGPIHDGFVTLVVEASLTDASGQRTVRYSQVSFQIERLRRVVVAVRPLLQKRLIAESDVRIEARSGFQIPPAALTELSDVVGKEVARETGAGEVLTTHMVRLPIAVRRGTPIMLLLDGPGFRITARGVALEEGGVGQMIRVMNQTSRKEVHGRVEDDGSVRIPF